MNPTLSKSGFYKKSSLFTVLFVAFIDFFGVGLVYPLFSSMLFDPLYPLVSAETSLFMRGLGLGLALTLAPLAQFFSSPMWGAFSDRRGRKKSLQLSLVTALVGYLVAMVGVWVNNFLLLLLSRAMIGTASGNTSVVQAAIADMSSPEGKAKNFGLYSVALGLGFALGPFIGGLLSAFGYSPPFLLATFLVALNLIFVIRYFEETHRVSALCQKVNPVMALRQLRRAFSFSESRIILIVSFLYNFGWSYFFEFAPVFLIKRFDFSSVELGIFYGVAGGCYALSAGLLIRPFVNRLRPETLFFGGIFLTALVMLALPGLPSAIWLWPVIFFICFFVSFVSPTSITLVSNSVGSDLQGEALGNLNAVNAAAFMMSPLCSGSLVGTYPTLPVWFGSSLMIAASLLLLLLLGQKKSAPKPS